MTPTSTAQLPPNVQAVSLSFVNGHGVLVVQNWTALTWPAVAGASVGTSWMVPVEGGGGGFGALGGGGGGGGGGRADRVVAAAAEDDDADDPEKHHDRHCDRRGYEPGGPLREDAARGRWAGDVRFAHWRARRGRCLRGGGAWRREGLRRRRRPHARRDDLSGLPDRRSDRAPGGGAGRRRCGRRWIGGHRGGRWWDAFERRERRPRGLGLRFGHRRRRGCGGRRVGDVGG